MPEGIKHDADKCRLDLLPVDALWEVGKVYTTGAKKYADRNWEHGLSYSRVFGALLRHLFQWWSGQTYDVEDGQHHLASVVWCGLALLHFDLNKDKYATFDNRPQEGIYPWENLFPANAEDGQETTQEWRDEVFGTPAPTGEAPEESPATTNAVSRTSLPRTWGFYPTIN